MKEESNGGVQHFLVSELLPFIPPAISAQSGIPMEKEVAIPLPANGGRDVELSTLYQVCPELFAAEITPLNDSVVTLPAKIGSLSDAPASFSPFSAPARQSEASRPRVQASSGGKPVETAGPTEVNQDNPFWSAPITPKQVVTGAKGFGNGFQSHSSPPHQKLSPGGSGTGSAANSVFSAPLSRDKGETPAPLAESSSDESQAQPSDLPTDSKSDAPFGFGSGMFGDAQNPFDSTEGFATLFSKQAKEDSEIPFPEPTSEPEAAEESPSYFGENSGSGWGIPKDPVAEEEEITSLEPDPGGESTAPEPPAAETGFAASSGFSSPASPSFQGPNWESDDSDESDAGEESRERDETNGREEGDSPASLSQRSEQEEESIPEIPATTDAPFQSEPQNFVSLTSPAQPKSAEKTSLPMGQESGGEVDSLMRDLEFRAIFSISEPFSLSRVARNVVGLEGISGCALATPAKIVQASKNEQSRMGEEAKEMVASIRALARFSGLPEAKSFTLHTDKGTVSLFLEDDCCVTVHHDQEDFAPGVREKLILVARNIHKLED